MMLVVNQPDEVRAACENADTVELIATEALERGTLGHIPTNPLDFTDDDYDFLRHQEATHEHTDIALDLLTNKLLDHQARSTDETRLFALLAHFSTTMTQWLRDMYPQYADGLVPDRATLRTEEEATRPGPLASRIDLLHIDNFAMRPSHGRRILRVCVNINPHDPRVWATAGRFTDLLVRYATQNKVPMRSREEWVAPPQSLLRLFTGDRTRTSYDSLMLKLHHFLKEDDEYQARANRKLWNFVPGAAWLLFTDGTAYAQLRGRYALEHSFFVPQESLRLPDESPLGLLEKFGVASRLRRAG